MQANNKSMIAFNIKSTTDWLTGQISHRRSLWEASSCTQRNSRLKTRPNKNKKQEWEEKCVGQAHSLTPTATNLGSSTTLCYKPPCWPHAWSLHTQVGKQLGSITAANYRFHHPCVLQYYPLLLQTCSPYAWNLHTQVGKQLGSVTVTNYRFHHPCVLQYYPLLLQTCSPYAWNLHTQVGKQLGSVTVTNYHFHHPSVYFGTTLCYCKLAHLMCGTCIQKWENSWVVLLSLPLPSF